MAARKVSSLLKYGVGIFGVLVVAGLLFGKYHSTPNHLILDKNASSKTTAVNDSAAESLDTLTAELATTKQQVTQLTQDNAKIKNQNETLIKKLQGNEVSATSSLSQQLNELKQQFSSFGTHTALTNNSNIAQPITIVPDLTETKKVTNPLHEASNDSKQEDKNKTPIPYYTIPANATAVKDKLMTALVGRIPIKGVVTDPYPFKIVFSDDTLAANGLRVPHLKQMIVSGYSEGDLNLVSVRGWVTSLTFVFEDGTISTTSSNDNDIGHFTKENALGFLSDKRGNPFISGKLISNAPSYLTGNILLGAAQGAATAYAQMQTTNQTSPFGTSSSSVTGSPLKYIEGQVGTNAANQAQQWWHDREENSFDAIYVSTLEDDGTPREIAVNFSKQIAIDYNPQGRKLSYENTAHSDIIRKLD